MGSVGELSYSVPSETQQLFEKEILANKRIPPLPKEVAQAAKHVRFTGNDLPSIPINWRFAESVSALKGFEATMLNVLRSKKYNTGFADVTVDTDHASLFPMTPFLTQAVNDSGETEVFNAFNGAQMVKYGFVNTDLHRAGADLHRTLATLLPY